MQQQIWEPADRFLTGLQRIKWILWWELPLQAPRVFINAAMDAGIPVIYTAVTDPLAAELADDEGNPVGEITGTSDKLR